MIFNIDLTVHTDEEAKALINKFNEENNAKIEIIKSNGIPGLYADWPNYDIKATLNEFKAFYNIDTDEEARDFRIK